MGFQKLYLLTKQAVELMRMTMSVWSLSVNVKANQNKLLESFSLFMDWILSYIYLSCRDTFKHKDFLVLGIFSSNFSLY